MNIVGAANTRATRRVFQAHTSAEAIRLLRQRRAVTTANDYGAIHAYNDNDGNYRCTAMRWMKTVNDRTFTSLRAVARWWTEWARRIGEKP